MECHIDKNTTKQTQVISTKQMQVISMTVQRLPRSFNLLKEHEKIVQDIARQSCAMVPR